MKKFNIAVILCCLLVGALQAQQRYLDEIFTEVEVTEDVPYGVNATVLTLGVAGIEEAIPEQLVFDFYEPVGDDETERPLVIYFHTGNFLPQPDFCSITGTQDDETLVEIVTRLTKRGYVVAVPTYRKGWNPLGSTQDERTLTLINAAYRGVQDCRTAIRYFKRNVVEEGNTFGVDTSRITVWGQGTGGYISLASATLDEYADILLPKFTTVVGGLPIPMVLEPVNGDIFGTSVGIVPPGFPPPFTAGDTLCYPNHVGYNSDFQLSVNMGGALGDLSWLDDSDPPMISFQVPNDSLAPYTTGVLVVSTTGDLIVEVMGAYDVQQKAADLGNNDVFATQDWIDPFSARANMLNDGADGLFPFEYPAFPDPLDPSGVITVSDPWTWWNPDDWTNVFCDLNPGVSLHDQAIYGHPLMSEASGMLYVDSIMGYFAPRACLALDLGCDLSALVSTKEVITSASVGLQLAPNPAADLVNLTSNADKPMLDVMIYDLNGRLMDSYLNIQQSNLTILRDALPTGMYIARVRFEEGMAVERFVFE